MEPGSDTAWMAWPVVEFFVAVGAALDIGLECWILGLAFLPIKKTNTSCDFLVIYLIYRCYDFFCGNQ